MKSRKVHLFLISIVNTIFLFLLVNNEKLILPYIEKLYDIKTYQEIMQNHVLVYPILLIVGVLQPLILIFLSAMLSWIIAMLVFQEDDFAKVLYLSTKAYWVVMFCSGIKLAISFFYGTLVPFSLAFLTQNKILHTFLEIINLDMVSYIIILSFYVARFYKNQRKTGLFMGVNFVFYFALSFLIKIIPMVKSF